MSLKEKSFDNNNIKVLIRFAALIVLGILVQIGAAYLLNGIMWNFGSLSDINSEYNDVVSSLTSLEPKMIVQVIVVSPVLEEAVFRLVFIGLGLKIWNDFKSQESQVGRFWILNLISSLFFGIYHGNIVQGIYGFILGLMLGFIYYYFGKYIASLVVHMVINTAGLYLTPILPCSMEPGILIGIGVAVMVVCCGILYILKRKTI